jgi:hypothetical protein
MIRTLAFLGRGLAAILALGIGAVSTAYAQAPQQGGTPSRGAPVMEYILAVLGTGLVLFILCVPSRKEE